MKPKEDYLLRKRSLGRGVWLALAALVAMGAFADASFAQDENRGWTLYSRVSGSTSNQGQVIVWNSTLGYNFNRFIGVDLGLPVYFTATPERPANPLVPPDPFALFSPAGRRTAGVGDATLAGRVTLANRIVNYGSALTLYTPTGDADQGHGTGQVTWDWTNYFDRDIGRVTPFADVGVGNTVSFWKLFDRGFTSVGNIAHFEAGTYLRIWRSLRWSGSAYSIAPWGEQRVIARFVPSDPASLPPPGPIRLAIRQAIFDQLRQTVGNADLTRDNGWNTSFSFRVTRYFDFRLGYSRSIPLRLDTVSYSIGLNLSHLFTRPAQSAQVGPLAREQKEIARQ